MNRKLALLLIIGCVLVAGSYIAQAQRPFTQSADNTLPLATQTVQRDENEKGEGSISGRAVNENGEPVAGLVVFVIYGRRSPNPGIGAQTGLIQTDKQGRFHVPNLVPAEYIVSVGWPCCQEPGEALGQNEAPYYRTAYTYYKDTPDRRDAIPVQVKANMKTDDVEITLRRPPLHKVSGTVFNRAGQPLPGAHLSLTRKQKPDSAPHSEGISTFADAQGSWSFEVPDGVYLIHASHVNPIADSSSLVLSPRPQLPMPAILPRSGGESQPRQVSVSGADVPNVLIDMNRRAQVISGKVVLEDGGPVPSEMSIEVAIGADWNYKSIRADGSFELVGPLLGEQLLSVIIQPFGAYYIKSISCDGTDYMREAFEFGNGVDYKGVEVVLSSRGTLVEIRMPVNGTKSRVTTGQVWLIPEDESKWRAPLTWFSSQIQSDRVFPIYAAPGRYLIIMDENVKGSFSPYDLNQAEDYIREHALRARRITLKAGERQSVEL